MVYNYANTNKTKGRFKRRTLHVPNQERIKGTEKASPIHTLLHR